MNSLNPAIVFLQETKLYYKGQISFNNFKVFETNRDLGRGGGLITTVNMKLDPVEIQSENNNPDVLIVQCKLSNYRVSLINGYGPQESESLSEKMEFFNCLEVSIIKSRMRGDFICVQLDANSKIGMENIIDDPNHISPNGQILLDIVERNDLIILNCTEKCIGTITRVRKSQVLDEKSVLDYFVVCEQFYQLVTSMEIDEKRKFVLTKYSSTLGVKSVVESDHNLLICKLNIKWNKKVKSDRQEVLKLKDSEGLLTFFDETSNCRQLVDLSQKSDSIEDDTKEWLKAVKHLMHKSFKTVRISTKEKIYQS